mmetsp:Transcript_95601/g.270324  ORF Transcript_95601/g.270324 Transcript_95601/m.270324 type:complete len:300 (+) Transcript_95601:607-1506(+)
MRQRRRRLCRPRCRCRCRLSAVAEQEMSVQIKGHDRGWKLPVATAGYMRAQRVAPGIRQPKGTRAPRQGSPILAHEPGVPREKLQEVDLSVAARVHLRPEAVQLDGAYVRRVLRLHDLADDAAKLILAQSMALALVEGIEYVFDLLHLRDSDAKVSRSMSQEQLLRVVQPLLHVRCSHSPEQVVLKVERALLRVVAAAQEVLGQRLGGPHVEALARDPLELLEPEAAAAAAPAVRLAGLELLEELSDEGGRHTVLLCQGHDILELLPERHVGRAPPDPGPRGRRAPVATTLVAVRGQAW